MNRVQYDVMKSYIEWRITEEVVVLVRLASLMRRLSEEREEAVKPTDEIIHHSLSVTDPVQRLTLASQHHQRIQPS